ncbi:MAG TPA: FtsX-like permease family protein [Phycisphaerae bacterium]|nr:FtsX-like permease family protein [Phycisphaerae bacterium]
MHSPILRILFIALAPLTVPLYLLFLAATNLLGGAFYIVIEATASRLAQRPISLSKGRMALLAVPVLMAAPVAMAVHLVIWFVKLVGASLIWIGHWQCSVRTRSGAFFAGTAWSLVALWTTLTCLNAAMGSAWIGRPVRGADLFVEVLTRPRTLGSLPPVAQERRRQLIRELGQHREAVHKQWDVLKTALEDDEAMVRWFHDEPEVVRKLCGVPWYFTPADLAEDGVDHSVLLLGPLFFVWLLLIRWPGTFALLRSASLRTAWLAVRLMVIAAAIWALIAWVPLTNYYSFRPDQLSWTFGIFSPAQWLGLDYSTWVRPEWYLFNAGLWIAIVMLLAYLWRLAWRVAPFLGWPRYYVAFLAARLLQRKRIAFFSVGAVTLCVAMMIIVISVMGGFVDSIRTRAHGLLGDLVMDGGLQGFPYYQEFIDRISKITDPETGGPLVHQATPLIHSYGILQFPVNKKTAAVRIWGIRLDEYVRVNEFGKDLFYQNRFGGTTLARQMQPTYGLDERGNVAFPADYNRRYQEYLDRLSLEEREKEIKQFQREPGDFWMGPGVLKGPTTQPAFEGKEFPGVIIGRSIIAQRTPAGDYRRSDYYPRGEPCMLTVLPMTRGGDISPEPPPKPTFRYVDDSRTGIHEIDSMNCYVDFDELQRLLSMGPQQRTDGEGMSGARCSQIQIKLTSPLGDDRVILGRKKDLLLEEWEKFCDALPMDRFEYDMIRKVDIQTWEEMQASYISAIEKEKFLVLIMFGVISIVAVFLILCIFYMIVQEKTRDIGIIKSIGGSAEGVAAVFLAYGGAIGLVGCLLGSLLGIVFVEHINDVQDWLARINPAWRVWSPETYSFDKIPDVWKWSEVIWISILAVVASIAGAAAPAIRAGRSWPVETLRYE